jgi:hypothetical protein
MTQVNPQSFIIFGREWQGSSAMDFFPRYSFKSTGPPDRIRHLKTFLEGGGEVFIEILKGARQGSVGRLVITAEDCDNLYHKIPSGWKSGQWALAHRKWVMTFDDRKNTVTYDEFDHNTVMRFNHPATTWMFTKKAKPKLAEWIPKDHFGVEITTETLVMFTDRRGNLRFGKPTRWSQKGTLWIAAIRSRASHHNVEIITAGCWNIVVCGPELSAQVTLAKLAL